MFLANGSSESLRPYEETSWRLMTILKSTQQHNVQILYHDNYTIFPITALYNTFTNIHLLVRKNFSCHQFVFTTTTKLSCPTNLKNRDKKSNKKTPKKTKTMHIYIHYMNSKRELIPILQRRQLGISHNDNNPNSTAFLQTVPFL